MIKSCYIHIPFCKKICSYCDFCKLLYNERFINKYLDDLEDEINNKYRGDILDTIYIGGGTPSCLDYDELERLFKIIKKFNTSNDLEYTIEGNIESIDKDKLLLIKKYGINRISIGIESIDKNNLEILDRESNKERIINTIGLIRELGFNNINLDLMYAIPNEDLDVLDKDIDFILSLKPEHISCYSLIIEDNTKLSINGCKYIEEELDSKMYNLICNKLSNNNYKHYEISNFCKDGYYSRHNMCYWKNNYYYGFGIGASSYIDEFRITNTRSISNYRNGNILEKELVDNNSKIEYEIILGLRLIDGIDLDEFYTKYNKRLDELYNYKNLIDLGLLEISNNHLRIPEDKLYVSNEIIVKLLNNVIE